MRAHRQAPQRQDWKSLALRYQMLLPVMSLSALLAITGVVGVIGDSAHRGVWSAVLAISLVVHVRAGTSWSAAWQAIHQLPRTDRQRVADYIDASYSEREELGLYEN